MHRLSRFSCIVLVAASTLVAARDLTGARPARAQAGGQVPVSSPKTTPHFAPVQVAIVTAVAPPKEKNGKPLDPGLAEAADRTLRNRFSAPDYRAVAPGQVQAALTGLTAAKQKPLGELPAADIVPALKIIGEATKADRVVYALVTEASSKDVSVALWLVDRKTGTATVNGKSMHRLWTDYLSAQRDPKDKMPSVGIKFNANFDIGKQEILISQMIQEWEATLPRK